MRRREFIALLGGAVVAAPGGLSAQQPPVPVIGFLSSASVSARVPTSFRKGLNETGFVPGENVTIEIHRAEGRYDKLPALAAELVRRRVTLIVAAGGLVSARAAKAATTTTTILFIAGFDPVQVQPMSS